MFAPPVNKKTKAKTANTTAETHTSEAARPASGAAEQIHLVQRNSGHRSPAPLAQHAGRPLAHAPDRVTAPGLSWDFSKIPLFPPDGTSLSQTYPFSTFSPPASVQARIPDPRPAPEPLKSNTQAAAEAARAGHGPSITQGTFKIARAGGPGGSPAAEGKVEVTGKNANDVQPAGGAPAAPQLPEGVPYQVGGWTATVRVSWLKEKGWSGATGSFSLADAIKELVLAVASARGFAWITSDAVDKEIPNLVLTLSDPGQAEAININMTRMLATFGPPPDMEIYWLRSGEAMTLVFRTDLILGTNPTQVNGGWLVKNPALNERIFAALEAKTGLSILPAIRGTLGDLQFSVLSSLDKGTIKPFTREIMESLFGKEAWQSYLDKPAGPEKPDGQEGGTGKEGGVKGGLNPDGDPKAVERLHKVYDYLKEHYPDQLKDKSFEDFVAWLQKQQAPAAPTNPDQELDFSDPAKWRALVENWVAGNRLPPTEDGKPTGVVADQYKFDPAGEMVLSPEIPDRRYVVGSEFEARMVMGPQPADNVLINGFPNKANFHWSVEGPEGGVNEGLLPDQGTGAISHSLKFLKPGVFVINVTVTSEHFRGSASLYKSRSVTVVDSAQRLDELFTGMMKGQAGPSLFEIGADGQLHVKEFAKGLTFDQQKAALQDQIATIKSLVPKQFTQEEAAEAIKLLTEKIEKLDQFNAEVGSAGRPYIAQAVFLSEVRSESWPLKLTMYDSVKKDADKIQYTVLIADLTSVSSAPRYTATREVPVGSDEPAARKQAERDAVDATCAALGSENAYPDGKVKLAVQLHESAPEIVTKIIDTRNLTKDVKIAAGYGGIALGAAGLVAGAVFTEGTTTPIWVKVIVVSAAAAGVVQAGVSIEQRVRTGQFGDDWSVEAVDILQIATSLASVGTMPLESVPGGVQLSIKVADKAQLVFLAASTKGEIDKANQEYQLDLTQGMKKEDAAKKRDAAIASILQGAAMTGGFVLMAHALHGAAAQAPGAPPPGEQVDPALRKLAYEGRTEEITAKMGEKDLAPEDRRFLSDMLDWRAEHGKPPVETEEKQASKPGEPGQAPASKENVEVPPATGEPAKPPAAQSQTPAIPEPKATETPGAKPEPKAPTPDVDPYPAGLTHIVESVEEAHKSYNQSISVDPGREAAIYRDSVGGEYLVVQGEHASVPTDFASEPGMEKVWILVEHYHPGSEPYAKLASMQDFYAMRYYQITGHQPEASISTSIRYTDPATKQPLKTEIGYDPHADKPYWITYVDSEGKTQTKRFEDTPWNANSDYERFLRDEGVPQEAIQVPKPIGEGSPKPAAPGSGTPPSGGKGEPPAGEGGQTPKTEPSTDPASGAGRTRPPSGWPENVDFGKVQRVLEGSLGHGELSPEEASLAAQFYDKMASQTKGTRADVAKAFNRERARYLREGTGDPPGKLADFVERQKNAPGQSEPPGNESPACFAGGTLVPTPHGDQPIESLCLEDEILSIDPLTGFTRTHRVAGLPRRAVHEALDLVVDGVTITCTGEHPYWVADAGWRPAKELAPGARLLSLSRGAVTVDSVQRKSGPLDVFNLTVDGLHTFLVSPLGVLVHNKAMARIPLPDRVATLQKEAFDLSQKAAEVPVENPNRAQWTARIRQLREQLDRLRTDLAAAETAAEREEILEPEYTDRETELRDLEEEMAGAVPEAPAATAADPRPHLNYPKNKLPTGGEVPYRSKDPNLEVTQSPDKPGYIDDKDNVWQVDRTKARAGVFFEWDVQHPDGTHTNVGQDGTITH